MSEKCKNCGIEITKFDGEWWHVSKCEENDGTGTLFPTISLRKLQFTGSHYVECGECHREHCVSEYCRNPEPKTESKKEFK